LSASYTQRVLRENLKEIVKKYSDSSLLLSGGLDSSILACLMKPKFSIVTSLGTDSMDIEYARKIARKYSENHIECVVDYDDIIMTVPHIVKTFKTFDPLEIRNSAVIYFGLKTSRDQGFMSVVTGDGADELFAGYNYMQRYFSNLEKLQSILEDLWTIMKFSSRKIGESLGVVVNTPYLEKQFYNLATSTGIDEKVGEHDNKKWGKFILRKSFEEELGSTVWRNKMALEQGSGFEKISVKFHDLIDDEEFNNESERVLMDGVKLKNKEHLYYYRIYESFFGSPVKEPCETNRCSFCSSCLTNPKYCYTCGAFPPI
jgi:asparagine synthase (glutamine-hydrolysing)